VPASHEGNPEFKPQYYQKEKNPKNKKPKVPQKPLETLKNISTTIVG
jgi:hypothetical protein